MDAGSELPVTSGMAEEDGVVGKVVKVSILEQLRQRFSKSPASTNRIGKLGKAQPSSQEFKAESSSIKSEQSAPPGVESSDDVDGEIKSIETETKCNDDENVLMEKLPNLAVFGAGDASDITNLPSSSEPEETVEVDSKLNESECPSGTSQTSKPRENIIRPINRNVVHQICSGQVIVTLSTAVKELVENSLDAGATKIDIRLAEYGSKLIEVSDDASGIEESNFEGLALKHHTSKIAEFEDLGNLSTFGFRGEALSSLCALANLAVITRHKESDQRCGYKIEYDNGGHITSKVRCARDIGTTVVLKDLFHTLPVRHKEFLKNLKKEFHRTVNVLYGYCLVVDSVRITCTNQIGSAAPQKVLNVPASNSMKERIVTLFGSKQLSSLIEIKQSEGISDDILAEFGLNQNMCGIKYEIEGYISKPNHGRSSNDRQFYFINSRPCDPAKISRVINEVYHTFSRQQNPFVCLHIKTNKENVDVNVTPDKRTVYVQNEKILLATVKASLVPLLTSAASSYNPINSLSSQSLSSFMLVDNSQSESNNDSESSICLSSSFEINIDTTQQKEKQLDYSGVGFDPQYSTSTSTLPRSVVSKTNNFIKSVSKGTSSIVARSTSARASYFSSSVKRAREEDSITNREESKHAKLSGILRRFEVGEKSGQTNKTRRNNADDMEVEEIPEGENYDESSHSHISTEARHPEAVPSDDESVYDDELEMNSEDFMLEKKTVSISVNWQTMSFKHSSDKDGFNSASSSVNYARKFRAKISPEDNGAAEDELKKQLSKDMFRNMDIVGQFNLGFIVVKNGPDLFIVDQHASDEKYNYEDQEKSFVLSGQLLISPLDLELPSVSENIIMDNIEVFQKNGFDFIISPVEEPTKRVKMSKIPFSKNIEFGKPDVEELIFMLEDPSSGKCFYRPTKVREMFASRACRKSVMIGTSLNVKEMRRIVDHMGEMEQPWNCPHGRPTIRHLMNLNILPDLDLTKFNH